MNAAGPRSSARFARAVEISSVDKRQIVRKALPPIRPNVGTEAVYRDKLNKMLADMHRSIFWYVRAAYRANPPHVTRLAADELPSVTINKAITALTKRWEKSFDQLADRMAKYFAQASEKRVSGQLEKHLQASGLAVEFKMTKSMRDTMNATIAEQVGLIRSIPAEYLRSVQGDVMRMVQTGGDLKTLSTALQKHYGVSKRRAALIARDQNNKAVASMTRTRMLEAGVKTALWVHSHGGKVPRQTHLDNNGKEYDVALGWFDPDAGKYIHPGQEINCRCVTRPVIRGFT